MDNPENCWKEWFRFLLSAFSTGLKVLDCVLDRTTNTRQTDGTKDKEGESIAIFITRLCGLHSNGRIKEFYPQAKQQLSGSNQSQTRIYRYFRSTSTHIKASQQGIHFLCAHHNTDSF